MTKAKAGLSKAKAKVAKDGKIAELDLKKGASALKNDARKLRSKA